METLRAIFGALADTASELPVVLPLHPRTRRAMGDDPELASYLERLRITEPLGYLDMAMLERNARLVVTDSGGVQKEAFFYDVPCVTLRGETEWTELVSLGWNRLVPPVSRESVRAGIGAALAAGAGTPGAPYGDGKSARRIADLLLGEG